MVLFISHIITGTAFLVLFFYGLTPDHDDVGL
jgi:hypothetical protein